MLNGERWLDGGAKRGIGLNSSHRQPADSLISISKKKKELSGAPMKSIFWVVYLAICWLSGLLTECPAGVNSIFLFFCFRVIFVASSPTSFLFVCVCLLCSGLSSYSGRCSFICFFSLDFLARRFLSGSAVDECMRVSTRVWLSTQLYSEREREGDRWMLFFVVLDMLFFVAVALFSSLLVKYLRLSLSSKDVSLM